MELTDGKYELSDEDKRDVFYTFNPTILPLKNITIRTE